MFSLTNLSPGYILKIKQRFESASEEYQLDKKALKDYFKCTDAEVDEVSLGAKIIKTFSAAKTFRS